MDVEGYVTNNEVVNYHLFLNDITENTDITVKLTSIQGDA